MWTTLLLLPAALASQVFYEPVPLDVVVSHSPVIALVEPVEGPGRDVTLPVGVAEGPAGPVPAFQTHLVPVRVVEVLRAPPGLVRPAQVVEVGAAHVEQDIALHRSYYVDGIAESPIYDIYESGLAPEVLKGRHILFLRPCTIGADAVLCGTIDGAVAAEADRARVLELARAHPWPGGGAVELPAP